MPKSTIGDFRGNAVHGGGGAYRYEDGSGAVVHVHPSEQRRDGWTVSADLNQSGSPGVVYGNSNKKEAFRWAYAFMEGYSVCKNAGSSAGGFEFGI